MNRLHEDIEVVSLSFFFLITQSLNGSPGGSSITVIHVMLSARNIRSRQSVRAFCTSSWDGLRNGR